MAVGRGPELTQVSAPQGARQLVIVAPAYLGLLRSLLTEVDCEVEVAFDGQQVLDLVRRHNPALLLLGADTPGIDGFKLCELVKSAPATNRIPVVIVTSRGSSEEHQRSIDCQADDILTKPISRVELLARVRSYLRLKELSDQVGGTELALFRLADELEVRTGTAKGHAERVALASRTFGERLRLAPADRDLLYRGGMLHDIGLVGVPERILRKTTPLTAEERSEIKRHPCVGEEMLRPLLAGQDLRGIVRHHHERADGGGYPDGLRTPAIPLLARIVAICDAYDALLSDRPYRSRRSPAQALGVLRRGAGRQWDGQLVEVFATQVAQVQVQLLSH